MTEPALIAIDWGTSRLRAWLVAADGAILDRAEGDEGIMAVPPGGFSATLRRHVGAWLDAAPGTPVVMAGMVGSRNGWVEAPYVPCPAGISDIAASMVRVPLGGGLDARIVPGLITRDGAGVPDVIRGEETKLAGCGLADGTVVMPGTHGKWARIRGGRIEGFATFMTGEVYGAMAEHTILGRLAEEPDDEAGFARGLEASHRPGGLTHQLFSARTLVLTGDMPGAQVRPYLSGLLIGAEIEQGLAVFGAEGERVLVADGAFARNYAAAFTARQVPVRLVSPETVFLQGLLRLLAA
jgi:2-dehydro-3-deoxygalactonokinase